LSSYTFMILTTSWPNHSTKYNLQFCGIAFFCANNRHAGSPNYLAPGQVKAYPNFQSHRRHLSNRLISRHARQKCQDRVFLQAHITEHGYIMVITQWLAVAKIRCNLNKLTVI
jgi:hypothetical protein